jgi:hypothetical protein
MDRYLARPASHSLGGCRADREQIRAHSLNALEHTTLGALPDRHHHDHGRDADLGGPTRSEPFAAGRPGVESTGAGCGRVADSLAPGLDAEREGLDRAPHLVAFALPFPFSLLDGFRR